jgi:hypothetical protein
MSPELRALTLSCRAYLDPEVAEAFSTLCRVGAPRWERLGELAVHHRVRPLLWRALSNAGVELPTEFREALRADCHAIAFHNLDQTRELLRVLRALHARGISTLPYKGAHLAALAYGGDQALRETTDIDLLAPRAALPRVKEVFADLGYRPHDPLPPAAERRLLRQDCEYNFDFWRDGALRYHVECHWRLAPRRFYLQAPLEMLSERPGVVRLAGVELPALAPEATLLALVVNSGAKERWRELRGLCDLAFMVQALDHTLDWPYFLHLARRLGVLGIARHGAALSQRLLAFEPPAALGAAQWKGHLVDYDWPPPAPPHPIALFAHILGYHVRRRDRFRHRLGVLAQHLLQIISPRPEDVRRTRLPPALHFLLFFAKVWRVVRGGK